MWLVVLIVVALGFDFLNGFNDSGNIVATMISSGAMSPRRALLLAACAEFAGPFLFGVAVAATIGRDVVVLKAITPPTIAAALLSAIVWNLLAWYFGLPSSSSHALIGGLLGATGVSAGLVAIQMAGVLKVATALVVSPIIGLLLGYITMKFVVFSARGASPSINRFFKRAQTLTSLAVGLSHGTNDAQKTMGVITMLLVSFGIQGEFAVPWWVVALSASTIALGMATGGWRIIRTLGTQIYRIRPIHGFTAQLSAASIILTSALLGGPVSTSQVVGSSIMGVGIAERMSRVRWEVVRNIVIAWIVTIPFSAIGAALLYLLVSLLTGG